MSLKFQGPVSNPGLSPIRVLLFALLLFGAATTALAEDTLPEAFSPSHFAPAPVTAPDTAPARPKTPAEKLADDFQKWLKARKLDKDSATALEKTFAENPSRETLNRYEWAFKSAAWKQGSSVKDAVTLARASAELPTRTYPNYKKAFEFAFGRGSINLSLAQARDFAEKASASPSALAGYRWAYGEFKSHGSSDLATAAELARSATEHAGRSTDEFSRFKRSFEFFYSGQSLDPQSANLLASHIATGVAKGELQPDALSRYQWVFRKMPPHNSAELQDDLEMADDLSRLPGDKYRDFQKLLERKAHTIVKNAGRTPLPGANGSDDLTPAYRRAFVQTGESFLPPTARTRSGWIEGVALDGDGKRSLDDLLSLGLTPGDIPAACSDILNLPVSEQIAPALRDCLALMPAINAKWPMSSAWKLSPESSRGLKLASEAFGLPEKLLACSFAQESGFNPTALSGAGASGISQITQDAFTDIMKVIQNRDNTLCPQALTAQWKLYRSAESSTPPVELLRHLPEGGVLDFDRLTQDPAWSIGAGALWTKCYLYHLYGTDDVRQLSIEDLAMVTGAYNLGLGGLKSYCRPHDIQGCLANLKAANIKETYNHILKIYSCLKKP